MTDDSTGGAPCGAGAVAWRKSTFSGPSECLIVAEIGPTTVAVRNSKDRQARTLFFERPGLAAWIAGTKAGEFDDLTG